MAGLIREEEARKVAEEVNEGGVRRKMEEEKAVEVATEENVAMVVEPTTGFSFPVELADGKQLDTVGLRKKKLIVVDIDVYAFGIYADNAKLKEVLQAKFEKAPQKPTKELYDEVINSDVEMTVRLIIAFGGLPVSLVRKDTMEIVGESVKKLTGRLPDAELMNKMMGDAKDNHKVSTGFVFEITKLPGYILQTKAKDELVSKVESELLCKAYFHMYLGDEPFDKEAKERFGERLLSLF